MSKTVGSCSCGLIFETFKEREDHARDVVQEKIKSGKVSMLIKGYAYNKRYAQHLRDKWKSQYLSNVEGDAKN